MRSNTARWIADIGLWIAGSLTVLMLIADAAASERLTAAPRDAQWQAECGACHVPYPPQLLPARSWRSIMATLDRHFGSDASVDAKSAAAIGVFLERNAGRDHAGAAPARVTEAPWFLHEHSDSRMPSTVRKSDCAACHRNAASGDFSERSLRVAR